ncbi:MAG: hypothetical protein ACAH11_14435 [Sphingomonas sp.]
MKYLIPLAAAAIFCAAPASAQPSQVTVENLQDAMNNHFGEGGDISLLTGKGEPGQAGAWSLRRRITGGSTPRRCWLRVEVPTVLENNGGTPTTSFTVDWAEASDVQWDGDRNVRFRTRAMPEGEFAEFRVEDSREANMIEAVLKFLVRECAKGTQ